MSAPEDSNARSKAKLARIYDDSAGFYHRDNYLKNTCYAPLKYRQLYIERMIQDLNLSGSTRILDIGCGPGELVLALTKRGYEVWGIDISSAMAQEATETLADGGFATFRHICIGDAEQLSFRDESFDVVIAAGVLEYQRQDAPSLSEMRRVLRKGGYLILNVTNSLSYVALSDEVYQWVKRKRPVKRVLSLIKERLLSRGPVSTIPLRRLHLPEKFDRELATFGFQKIKHNYFRFSPLPIPFNSLLRSVCDYTGRYMERLTASPIGFIGGGYLVLCVKRV